MDPAKVPEFAPILTGCLILGAPLQLQHAGLRDAGLAGATSPDAPGFLRGRTFPRSRHRYRRKRYSSSVSPTLIRMHVVSGK